MARSIRVDQPGHWHHVMNRGVDRQRVYFVAGDARRFLELVGDATRSESVNVHAYCLMTNHFHLLVETPFGGLSSFMKRVLGPYTQQVNRRLGRDGPLFRGRYHSRVVGSERYVLAAARYVHRNPMDLGVDLASYRWSSLRYYVDQRLAPTWLETEMLRALFGGDDGVVSAAIEGFDEAEVVEVIRYVVDTGRDDFANPGATSRVIAAAMIDHVGAIGGREIERFLGFGTAKLSKARQRARERVDADPAVARAVVAVCSHLATKKGSDPFQQGDG